MKEFKFNHNDYVSVVLTDAGAKHISSIRNDFYNQHPKLKRGKCNYEEGELYHAQFWSLVGDFHPLMHIGSETPFLNGKIIVESSLEH